MSVSGILFFHLHLRLYMVTKNNTVLTKISFQTFSVGTEPSEGVNLVCESIKN